LRAPTLDPRPSAARDVDLHRAPVGTVGDALDEPRCNESIDGPAGRSRGRGHAGRQLVKPHGTAVGELAQRETLRRRQRRVVGDDSVSPHDVPEELPELAQQVLPGRVGFARWLHRVIIAD
jgi:hypothetical protein